MNLPTQLYKSPEKKIIAKNYRELQQYTCAYLESLNIDWVVPEKASLNFSENDNMLLNIC
jgi:hypothetical protein